MAWRCARTTVGVGGAEAAIKFMGPAPEACSIKARQPFVEQWRSCDFNADCQAVPVQTEARHVFSNILYRLPIVAKFNVGERTPMPSHSAEKKDERVAGGRKYIERRRHLCFGSHATSSGCLRHLGQRCLRR